MIVQRERSVMIETVGFYSIGGGKVWKVLRDGGNRETDCQCAEGITFITLGGRVPTIAVH